VTICYQSAEPAPYRTGRKLRDNYMAEFMPGISENENGNNILLFNF